MREHRGQLRYPLTGRGQFTAGSPPVTVSVRLLDISEAGTSFLADVAIAVGARGQLGFTVLGADGVIEAAPRLTVQTCVLERRMYRIGAQFSGNDAATEQQLARVLAARAQVVKGR